MELSLIEGLIEAVRLGQRADIGFKGVTWSAILPRVQARITQRNPDSSLLVVIQEKVSAKKRDLRISDRSGEFLKTPPGLATTNSRGLLPPRTRFWRTDVL
jgi:hypothetical protein